MKKSLLAILFVLACVCSCKSEYEALLNSNDISRKYDAAFAYFNEGKYSKASALFESLAMLTNGTERDDTVQYYWGLSNYRFKDYITAQSNFESFIDHYPRSPFTESASFLRCDCLFRSTLRYELDQSPTYLAITEINKFIIEYPRSEWNEVCHKMLDDLGERLDKKAFENARLYYNMEDYKAARVALKNILKDDADNIYREDILYYTALSSYNYAFLSIADKQHERYLSFKDDYFNFIGEYPDSKYTKELERLYSKAKDL